MSSSSLIIHCITAVAFGAVTAGGSAPLERPAVFLSRALPNPPGRADVASNLLRIPGGAIISGWTFVDGGRPDGLLMRVTDEGEVVWRREIGGAGTDLLWSVVPADSGGFRCLGFTNSKGAGDLDGWMIRVDSTGAVLWEKTYGGPGEDRLTAMKPAPYGWVAVGQTAGRGRGGLDALVVRMDPDGNELGSWTDGETGLDRAFGIEPMEDGGVIIAGMMGDEPEAADVFVTRLGPDGRRMWRRRLARRGFGVAHDIHRAANGDLWVYGYAFVNDDRHIDGFAIRLDVNGRVIHERTFGGATYDRANHAELFEDGSAMVVGYSQRPGAADEETHWDLVLYALDPKGQAIWTGRFGGVGVEFGRMVAGSPEDLWVVGHTSTGRDGSGVLLIRLDATGVVGGGAARSRASAGR